MRNSKDQKTRSGGGCEDSKLEMDVAIDEGLGSFGDTCGGGPVYQYCIMSIGSVIAMVLFYEIFYERRVI